MRDSKKKSQVRRKRIFSVLVKYIILEGFLVYNIIENWSASYKIAFVICEV